MTTDFDPYLEWLGIPPERQPPTHYALLGLDDFEPDRRKISAAADSRLQYLRDFQTGPRGRLSQQVLNEIARAKLCLLNADAKADYDRKLKSERAPRTPPIIDTGSVPPPLPASDAESAFKIKVPERIGRVERKAETESVSAQLSNLRTVKPRETSGAVTADADAGAETREDSASTADTEPEKHDADRQSASAVPLFRRKWFPFAALSGLLLLAVSVWLIGWTAMTMLRPPVVPSETAVDVEQEPKQKQGMTTSVFSKQNQIDYPPGIRPEGRQYELNASNAELAGALITEKIANRELVSGWKLDSDRATWQMSVPFPGFYRASISYSAKNLSKGDSIRLSINDWKKIHSLRQTASESDFVNDELIVLLRERGTIELHLAPESLEGEFFLQEIKLTPKD